MEKNILEISLKDLIVTCTKDYKQKNNHYKYFREVNSEIIHDIFRYRVFYNDFIDSISCILDLENIISDVKPSYDLFLKELIKILNLDIISYKDDEELTKRLLERLDKLLSIKTEQELDTEFPKLYYDLISGRKYFYDLQKYRRYTKEEEYKEKEHYFYACGLQRSLKNFITTQARMYKRYIMQRKELKEKYNKTSYIEYIKFSFDKDKLKMFIIYNLLNQIEDKLISVNNYHINLIENYLNNNKDSNINININNETITIKDIINKYNGLSINRPQEKIVEWQIIPNSRYIKKPFIKAKKQQITLMNHKEIEKLIKIGEEKQAFYEQSNYYAKAVGLRRYCGYVAYIYENGEVILDKEYKETSPRTASGNAIYNMRINEFRTLSRLDKKVLKKHPNVKRICHIAGWQDRVKEIIERKASPEEIEATHEYVYYLK